MSTWNIYHKDGSKLTDVNGEQITVHGLEYSDSWMGECFLTINFKHEVPINFQIGDYIIYRNERFELNYEPGKDKQARPDTYGEGFVYDSVKFNALQDELARAEFLDVVLNDNELHYTALPKFPFFVQTLDDFLDRIQANLDEQIGAGLWKIYSRNKERSVQRGCLVSEWLSMYGEGTSDNVIESMSITIGSKTCWEALALVNEKWNVNFIVRGRNIYVGTTGIEAGHIFSYGLGKGLYEIVQNADSDQSVITRLRAYGSEKNLPSHYYADLGVKYVANITKVVTASTNVELELDVDYIETYFKNKRKYVVSGESQEQSFGWVLQVTFDFQTTITGYVTQSGSSGKCRFYSELKGTQTDTGDEESKEKLDTFISQVKAGNTKMYIMSGLNKKVVPSSMKEYAKNLPNNMSINRLMLPGFPHVSLSDFYDSLTEQEKKYVNPTGKLHKFSTDPYRPYIDSLNIEEVGLRSASQFFDTDDKTNGVIEIYPTIEEMEIGGVRVDEIDEGVAPDDDGRFGDNETVKNVDIYLNKAIDFDINDLKDDDFSISMKDGMCGGRTFKVASSTKVDGRWRLTIERSKDDALELWFPYKDYPIKNGDHFVLSGITLPDSYVKAASLKLLKYAIALLDKNDYTRYVYQPKVDELFMARQHDKAQADETGTIKSLHDTLKAGDLMNFNDTDLNIEGIISIDQLTIKEEDGKIPTYDITLREDKEVGTIQKIQQQISSLQNGNGGTGAGLTTTQVKNQVATEGSKHFISKINDDTAKGTITWEKVQKLLSGLLVGNFNNENGGSWTPDTEGRSHLITDYLEVRMKAIFEELVIKKTSTIGGKEIISPAGGVVAHKVEEVTVTYNNVSQKAYRCYFLAEQEGDAVDNDFAIGDQVRSESFNVRKGTYHKVGNHFYWRLVIGRDEDPVGLEGKKYHYIDLSDTDCATASDVPAKGDVLSQCGNRTDVERQNCLIFSAVDTYSPSISLYHGINSYSFANREYVQYGVNKQTNKAFFNVYGDMYVGDRPTKENGYEGSSYIKYDSAAKQVSVKGKISAKSTVDGKELSQYIKENSAKGLTEEQVNNLIKNSQVITDLQNQVDGAIETWFYEGVPTLNNAPASSWTTDKDKDTHLGDLYYDNKTGKAYRFAKDGNTYKWTIITDTDIAKALSDASKAQETADGKMKVFSTQPIPPYQVGDIWVNATYPTDGSTYKNEILRCQTAKAKGSSFAIADWTKASKYTDDSALNTFKEEYKNDMASYKEQLDEKVETWFYNYAPTTQNKPASDWTTDTLKSQHAGDLFYNTSNGYTYRWTGTAWARIKDNDINTAMTAASKAQDTADGKRTVFTSQPTVPYDEGDLWASGGDDGKTLMVCIKGRTTGSFTSSEWVKANDSDLNAFAKTIEESLTGIQDQLDKKAETWYQATDPSTSWTTDDAKKEHKGDLWYNTSNNQTFFWNGTKWDKQDVPTEVFDKIDGKSSIYVSKPASYEERDLWILEAAYTLGGVAYSKGELVVATKSNASFSAADWTKKVKYTDDTVANTAKKAAEEAKKAADTAQTNVTNLGKTVTSNKKAFDSYVTDGYLEPSEIAAMAQDSKRLEDAFAAAEKSYNEVKGAEVLKSTKELTDLNTAFTTLSTAKKELITYLSDISTRYNAADTEGKANIVSAVGTKFTNFQSAYSAFYDKLGLANAYITSKIYGDLKQNITDLAGYKYLKDALGQTTDIDGGLVMTTLLALRDGDGNVQSGINGAIDPNRGKKSIATWWGGQMVDKDYNSGNLTPATSLIRFDGSGYLANGAIWWDVSGKVHADPTSFIISEKNLGAYLTFFEPTWKAGSDGSSIKDLVSLTPQAPFKTLSVSNDLSVEGKLKIGSITLSVVNGALKIDGNVYSTGGMSAYGEGTSNGGGLNGSIVPFDKAKSLTAQNEGTEIASAWSIKQLYDMINSIDVTGQLTDYLKKTEASTLYQPKGNYLTSHQDISGKSDKTHTHSVKINGVTKTIAATGGTAVDLGTYLTSHQSLAAYLKSADAEKTYSKLGHTHAFSEITGKPTTLAGYGATDGVNAVSVTGNGNAVTSASIDGHTLTLTKGSTFSLSGHTHTFASLTSKPTTIAGYGITDAYTKAQVDSTIAKYLPLAGGTITGALTVNGIATFKSKVAIGDIYIINDGSGNLYVQKTDGKTAANFYATGGITAFGASSVSGGTGSGLNGSVLGFEKATAMTSADNGDSSKTEVSFLATAWSIKQLNDKINAFGTGVFSDYLTIAAAKATYQPKGSYLTSHQTIYGLTIQKNGTSLGTYTPNSAAKTINVTVPTKLSELSNDSGYTKNTGTVTSVAISVPTGLSVSGSPITTNGTIAIALASGYSIPTTAKQTAWDGAVSAKHTHSNKSVLDGISSTKVSHWNSAYDWYALMTTDEETADGIINKWNEVVSFLANIAQTDTLSGIVDGINKSISDEVARAKKAEGVNASGISANKGSIATLQGYFTNGSAKKALQLTNARKLWGNSFNGTADINGSIIVPSGKYISIGNIKLEYDAANKALKITNTTTEEVANLYTSGGVSAYGAGTSSSSGGGGLNGSVKAYNDALKLTSESLSEVASAYSIKQLYDMINSIDVTGQLTDYLKKTEASTLYQPKGNYLTSHQDISGKSDKTHTHSVKINGVTKTIAATGGTAVDLGTYLTSHQSLAAYLKSADAEKTYSKLGHTHAFSEITGKPTTLAGYGATDGVNAVSVTGNGNAVTSASIDGHTLTLTKGSTFSLSGHTHTFASLTSKPTTIAGYGITDAYTKAQVDSTIAKYLPLAGGTITGALTVNGIATFKSKVAIGDIYIINDGSGNLYVQKTDGKTAANFYATGGITAFGASSVSGGTGSGLNGSVLGFEKATAMTSADNGDSSKTEVSFLATAWSIKQLNDKINAFGTGVFSDYLTIAAAKATYQPKGSYLTSHQTIYGLTIQKNGTSLGTYTPNSAAKTINVTVPTKLSELSNDSGYTKNTGTVTSVAISVPTGLSVSGSPITTNGTIAIALASGYSIPTTAKQTAWDGAVSAKHTHSNKSVLDGISSTKVSHWNSAYDWYALMTTDEETADGIINKWNEVVSFLANIAQTDTLSGIVDGINKSISDEVARAKKAEGVNASGISANKGSIATLQGYFTNGSAKKALQLTNARKLWGNSFNGTADINGSIIVPSGKYISIGNIKLEYDAANKALKITNTTTEEVANLYTSGGVSAYGAGTSSSSGGGGLNGSVKAYNDALKLTSESLSEVASAYSIKQLSTRITSLEGGSATSISVSGSGNAVTSITKNGTTITVTKGATFLTAHQSLSAYMKTADAKSLFLYHTREKIVTDLDNFNTSGASHIYEMIDVRNTPTDNEWIQVMNWGSADANYGMLLANDYNINGSLYFRHKVAGKWNAWKTLIDSSNIANQSVKYATTAGTAKNPNALSWSGYASGSYDGSAAKSISIPNNTNQLTNGAGFITASASITGNAATATKVNHSLSVFGKLFNGSADVTVADKDLIASISTATANLTDKTEILTSYASDNGFNDSNAKNRIHRRPASAIWGYINSKTISNADKLDNVHLNGIFTALSNTNNGVSMTIGTVAKSLANMQVYSATKLATARNIALGHDFRGSANFDGTGNITINGHINAAIISLGPTDPSPFKRIAHVQVSGSWNDNALLLYLSQGYIGGYFGICRVEFGTNDVSEAGSASASVKWLFRHGYATDYVQVGFYSAKHNSYMDVFVKTTGGYQGTVIRCLQDSRGSINSNVSLLKATATTEAYTSIEAAATALYKLAYTAIVKGSDAGAVNYANSAGNAGTLDGIHANGLFTNLSNNGNNLSITIGGTNKTLTVGYATKAAQLNTARTLWGQSFDGTGNVNGALSGATTISASNTISTTLKNGALKIGNKSTPISAIDDEVIFNTGGAIRFGETAWDFNQWAGLKYNHSSKTIYLGIADGSVFNANSAQSGGKLKLINCGLDVPDNIATSGILTVGKNIRLINMDTNVSALFAQLNGESLSIGYGSRMYATTQMWCNKFAIYCNEDIMLLNIDKVTATFKTNILATGGVTAYASSDARLKTDLRKLDYLGIIKAMGGTFGFAWKKDNTRSIGWIAQHVLCNPHLKDIVETDEKGYYKINYWSPKLIATAFGAIEQVGDEVSRLKARVVFLESEVQRLSGKQDGNNKKRLDNKNINLLN